MGATATVKGGLFEQAGLATLTQISGVTGTERRVQQLLSRKGARATRALMLALDGVVAGSNATATVGRVEANVEQGGKRVIETQTLINRNTVAGDVTTLNADMLGTLTSRTTFGASPPANKDGNPLGTR